MDTGCSTREMMGWAWARQSLILMLTLIVGSDTITLSYWDLSPRPKSSTFLTKENIKQPACPNNPWGWGCDYRNVKHGIIFDLK